MSATIDRLEIEIGVNAKNASQGLDRLTKSLMAMRDTVNGVESGKLNELSSGLNKFATAMLRMKDVKASDFNKLSKGIQKITTINPENIQNIANGITPLSNSLYMLSSVKMDNKNLTNMINALIRVGNARFQNIGEIRLVTEELTRFANSMSAIGGIEARTSSLVNAIARISNSGEKAKYASQALPQLGLALKNTLNQLSKAKTASDGAIQLTNSISKLANAGSKTKVTADNLDYLGDKVINFIKSMQKAPQLNSNTVMLLNAIGNISNAGRKANSAFSNVGNVGMRTTNKGITSLLGGFKRLIPQINTASNSSRNLASSIGLFYAKFFMVIRAFKALGNAIEGASDYIEAYNYFDVAISKIGKDSSKNLSELGKKNAKDYSEAYKKELTNLSKKMTGFSVSKSGELASSGMKSLGLDITELTQFQARIAQMTNSVGMLGDGSIATSKALSMLSGDLSSLTNLDLEQVQENLTSGLSGMTMAVRKYGIDISVATLKQYAFNLGIKKNITDMSQAEKQYLRMIAILDQSKVSWGDLAKTVNSPANQFRMLKNNIKQCGMMIGRLFMPMIQSVLPWINAMTMAIKDLIQWIGDLFGIKWQDMSSSMTADTGLDNMADDVDTIADNIDNATDSAKKFNKQLQGFDELNNLTTSTSSSSNKDNSSVDDTSGVLNEALIKAVEDYEKRWNKAFSNMTSDADNLKNKIEEVFKRDWKTADFTDVGATLGTWIKNGLNKLNRNMSQFDNLTQKIGKSIGTAITGFVKVPGLASAIGTNIAGGLNSAVLGLDAYYSSVSWSSVGSFFAKGLNKFLVGKKGSDLFPNLAHLLAVKLNAAFSTIGGFASTFKWNALGNTIAKSINTFFNTWDAVSAGVSMTKLARGILKSINTSLEKTNFQKVGKKIGDMIAHINWGGVAIDMVKLCKNILKAIRDFFKGLTGGDPLVANIATSIVGIFAIMKWTGITSGLFGGLGSKVVSKIGEAISSKLASSGLATTIGTSLTKIFSKAGSILVTIGKKAIGLYFTADAFRRSQSDNVLESLVASPIEAFIGALTLTGNPIIALGIGGLCLMTGFAEKLVDLAKPLIDDALEDAIPALDEANNGAEKTISEMFTSGQITEKEFLINVKYQYKDATDDQINFFRMLIDEGKTPEYAVKVAFEDSSLDPSILENNIEEIRKYAEEHPLKLPTKLKTANETINEAFEKFKKMASDKNVEFPTKLKTATETIKEAFNKLKNIAKNQTVQYPLKVDTKQAERDAKAAAKRLKKILFDDFTSMYDLRLQLSKEGFTSSGKTTKQYANGGFPTKGELFMAREDGGTEMVGKFGSKSGVANNQQIVDGISDGVFNALAPVLTNVATELSKMNGGNGNALYVEGLSEGDIVKITTDANNRYKKRTGKPLYT